MPQERNIGISLFMFWKEGDEPHGTRFSHILMEVKSQTGKRNF